MKSLSVILAFHAHEPSWRLPAAVLASLRDEDLRREDVGNDDWIQKRAESGRDVYGKMLDLGERLGAPISLEATNELLMQLRRWMPATLDRLAGAYKSGALYPIYGNAFHTHIVTLSDEELADELRLNQEFVHEVLGAPRPGHPGAFPMEGSIDAHRLAGFTRAGMEYVVFPQLSTNLARYRFEDGEPQTDPNGDFTSPFVIGDDRLLALPRHFRISQEIWRPITRWQPERLAPQGYILGKYFVLDEEYRNARSVDFPISREEAIADYAGTLRSAITDASDGGLLLYIQDLELMDFGEEALDIMAEAWDTVRREGIADIRFVTPDTYIDELADRRDALPRLRFHQASWAPEIRLVLRSDGHYPPRHAGPFRGIDNDEEVFRRWPFIFWEPGRFIVETCKSLLAASGHNLLIPLTAGELEPSLDDLAALDVPAHLALHIRAMQRACNTGWQPDEARHKWLYMHAVAITEILRAEAYVANLHRLPSSTLRGLDRVLEIFIDTRIAYLAHGIESLGDRAGSAERHTDARAHLANAERRRKRASALARQLAAENTQLISDDEAVVAEIARTHPTGDAASRRSEAASLVERQAAGPRRTQRMLALLQEHCKEAFLALNEIQRAWMCIEDTAGMIEEMYAWLYDQYPPRFPSILRDLLTPGEAARLDAPLLA